MVSSSRALIVLVHGFMGTRVQLLPIAASLARRYEVLNLGYRSRNDTLAGHAVTLIDNVQTRARKHSQPIHFVTHSFGGVVLHRAFSQGLMEVLKDNGPTRCVLIAPPLRGASFARAFQRENLKIPELLKDVVHTAARAVLGNNSGQELLMNDKTWFDEKIGRIPDQIPVLVVAGNTGKVNPLIPGISDGVVGVEETMLKREHFRLEVGFTHNLLLYNPTVMSAIPRFLNGEKVGRRVHGVETITD